MKELVILSGKGGTGKTSITASFARLAERPVIADCDVDAADLHLVIPPVVRERHVFMSGHQAVVMEKVCCNCGVCLPECRFGAIMEPAPEAGHDTFWIDPTACEGCGACYPPCPPMQINDPENSKLAIRVGGKNSNARGKPTFMKMVASGLPNNAPRWPEVGAAVKNIISVYKDDARPWERMADWIDRIGWPRFFEKTGLPFTKYLIDDWTGSRANLNASTHIRF